MAPLSPCLVRLLLSALVTNQAREFSSYVLHYQPWPLVICGAKDCLGTLSLTSSAHLCSSYPLSICLPLSLSLSPASPPSPTPTSLPPYSPPYINSDTGNRRWGFWRWTFAPNFLLDYKRCKTIFHSGHKRRNTAFPLERKRRKKHFLLEHNWRKTPPLPPTLRRAFYWLLL